MMLCFPLSHALARHVLRGPIAQPCCRPRASLAPSYSRVQLATDRLLPEPAAGSVRSDDDEQGKRALPCAPWAQRVEPRRVSGEAWRGRRRGPRLSWPQPHPRWCQRCWVSSRLHLDSARLL